MADIVPKDKRELALVALGKKEERDNQKAKAVKGQVAALEKKNRALTREKNAAVDEAAPTHRMALGGGFIVGAGAGLAGQHYVADKYIKNKYAQRGTLPGLGLLVAAAGFFVDGAAGDAIVGVGLGVTAGSAATSTAKYLAD